MTTGTAAPVFCAGEGGAVKRNKNRTNNRKYRTRATVKKHDDVDHCTPIAEDHSGDENEAAINNEVLRSAPAFDLTCPASVCFWGSVVLYKQAARMLQWEPPAARVSDTV